jgi:O-antigen ligase
VRAGSLCALAAIFACLAAWVLQERLQGLFAYDPTVQVRIAALEKVWHLVEQYSWTGVGYNAYQFAARKEGLISSFTIHSRAGADSSWLTLWITVGLPGLVIFAGVYLALYVHSLQGWLTRRSLMYLALLASLSALATHAFFVNSLLYSHLLITLAIIAAITLCETKESHGN